MPPNLPLKRTKALNVRRHGKPLQTQGKVISWLCLAAASYLAAAALSGAASMYGLTVFPNDHRGEWGAITVPILLLLAIALGTFGFGRLVRVYRPWLITIVAIALVAASFLWLSWRFAHAAA